MGYQFNLEALRRYRLFEEERLQKELADTQRICDQAMTVLAEHIARRDQTESDFNKQQTDMGSGPQLEIYSLFLRRLAEKIKAQEQEVETAAAACENKRKELLEAMKKRKALEKLKEKGLQAYLADLSREEQKFLNEMAINRFTLNDR